MKRRCQSKGDPRRRDTVHEAGHLGKRVLSNTGRNLFEENRVLDCLLVLFDGKRTGIPLPGFSFFILYSISQMALDFDFRSGVCQKTALLNSKTQSTYSHAYKPFTETVFGPFQEFPVSVDTLYEYLFTESDFYKRVQKARRTKGV